MEEKNIFKTLKTKDNNHYKKIQINQHLIMKNNNKYQKQTQVIYYKK